MESDIEDWRPDALGEMKRINCAQWDCDPMKWYVYWMRSIPGMHNGLRHDDKPLTNWWIYTGDYDLAVERGVGLVEKGAS